MEHRCCCEDELDGRTRLMLSVVEDMLNGDSELRLCEGLRLLQSIETACARAGSEGLDVFVQHIRPRLHAQLLHGFGICPDPFRNVN